MNTHSNQNNDDTNATDASQIGAACNEIISESNESSGFILPPIDEVNIGNVIDDFDIDGTLPLPPLNNRASTSNTELNHSTDHRRYSYAIPSIMDSSNLPRNRIPSMPSILPSNQADDMKKFTSNSSRRSSFESAYHSHISDQSPRPASNASSQTNHNNESTIQQVPESNSHDTTSTDNTRRDSLSYEAIREYFLTNNPYRNINNTNNRSRLCTTQHNDTNDEENCPYCSNINDSSRNEYLSSQFRTFAHQQIVQNQFEELLDIPDPRTSRSTSIDLFSGIDLSSFKLGQTKDSDNDVNDDDDDPKN